MLVLDKIMCCGANSVIELRKVCLFMAWFHTDIYDVILNIKDICYMQCTPRSYLYFIKNFLNYNFLEHRLIRNSHLTSNNCNLTAFTAHKSYLQVIRLPKCYFAALCIVISQVSFGVGDFFVRN